LRGEADRIQKDAGQKIAALNERIKQLNAQLADVAAGARKATANEGFFKR
jgi:prefoldin subunit 5